MRIFPGNIFLPTQILPQIHASCHRDPSLSLLGGQLLTAKTMKQRKQSSSFLVATTFWSFGHENLDLSVTLSCSSKALQGLLVCSKERGPLLL